MEESFQINSVYTSQGKSGNNREQVYKYIDII